MSRPTHVADLEASLSAAGFTRPTGFGVTPDGTRVRNLNAEKLKPIIRAAAPKGPKP